MKSLGQLYLTVAVTALYFAQSMAQNVDDVVDSAGTKIYLNQIFQQFGEKNGTVMSQGRFNALLKQLTLGNVYIEKLEKFCLHKGEHNGFTQEPSRSDPLSNEGGKESVLKRTRRSGNHGEEKGTTESPRHSLHLEEHFSKSLFQKEETILLSALARYLYRSSADRTEQYFSVTFASN
eukprot:gene14236-5261_t